MRPGREMDTAIAKEVFGHRVWVQAKVLYENGPKGDRPLRNYSKEFQWAWEVMDKMKITLIPIEGQQWFAFAGPVEDLGWESPQAVLQFLEAGEFAGCGASVGEKVPQVICEAALRAVQKRRSVSSENQAESQSGSQAESQIVDQSDQTDSETHVSFLNDLKPDPRHTH